MSTVKVRIAPSPTGDPHVGTAYIALFNYAFARHMGGKFVLRIEDTDQTRSTRQSEEAILRALHWLGLAWDEGPDVGGPCGPYRQSERTVLYREHAWKLVETGGAYPCFCTADRLGALREEQRANKLDIRYDGACRALDPASARRRADAGEPFVIRLKMPQGGATLIQDGLRGEVSYLNSQMDDQVLLKSDGFPTYHLANVVDDHLMGITHVIRAEEWIPSTPKHLRLYELFGWQPPAFYHLPLLRNKDRSKISKRKNPVSLDYYRRAGFLPEAVLNFLALMGYSTGDENEIVSLDQMIATFDWARVSLGGPVFDLEKLEWLNGHYIRALTPDQMVERVFADVLRRDYVRSFVEHIQPRIRRLDEFIDATTFFFNGRLDYDPELLFDKCRKRHDAKDVQGALEAVAERLDKVVDWTLANVEAALREWTDAEGWKAGDLFMAVRIATTGRAASPGLFETMEALGKPIVQFRLRDAVEKLKPLAVAAVQARVAAANTAGKAPEA